jgi:asparagine synthase (glutamine-hydrolysing)
MYNGHFLSGDSLNEMLSSIRYRGPDATGIYIDDFVGLGHVRLSIIDLAGGNQPVHNEDQTIWIVYNGEIYNYVELRADLEKKGHRFYTTCDTEVLVHLYEEHGTEFLNLLNGQWAFAIYDKRNKRCFLSRDRVGVRPLFYTQVKGLFIFASEIKAIFELPQIERSIDTAGLDQIFTFWTTLPGRTIFEGIKELPPGHYMDLTADRCAPKKYWDIPLYGRDSWENGTPQELAETTRELFIDAVKIRLRADVPVATYLSGGLDSSGVTAIVAQKFNPDVQTFGIRFEEEAFDEGEHQNAMVRHLGVKHREILASNQAIGESFAAVVRHCEKPILRTAPVPLYLLAKLVRESGIKVVLTGEGSDEFHGGYDIFKEALVRSFWGKRPESVWRGKLIERLYPDIFRDDRSKKLTGLFFGRGVERFDDPFFSHQLLWSNTSRIKTFFSDEIRSNIGSYNPIDDLNGYLPHDFNSWHVLHRAQYLEIAIFMSNYLLSSQGDRMGMAHSVEVRMPFLDHRLMEFMGRVPPWWKICGLHEKHILKKALAPFLPPAITARVKHPYSAPIQRSLLSMIRSAAGQECLSEKALADSGLFDAKKVGLLVRKLAGNAGASETDSMALAGILSMQLLFCEFISAPCSSGHPDKRPDVFIDQRSGAI